MRKLIILFAAVCGCVMAQADEIDAVKFVQNGTTDWYLLASNPEVTFTNGNPVINGKTYDLADGIVETRFGTDPTDPVPTVLFNTKANGNVNKFLRDGQVIVRQADKEFNILGIKIR